ncbi:MAG: PD-(D/E)XK nuclease family protein [Polyangiaceae bacterium]
MPEPRHQLWVSHRAERRLSHARAWLGAQGDARRLLLVGTPLALSRLVHGSLQPERACFGWQRQSLSSFAGALVEGALAESGRLPATELGMEAAACRVIAALHASGQLGRFAGVGQRPGLPRALVRTFNDLELGRVSFNALESQTPDLVRLLESLRRELARLKLVTRAQVLDLASNALADCTLEFSAALFLDPRVHHAAEAELLAALGRRLPCTAVFPHGDKQSEIWLARAFGVSPEYLESDASGTSLDRLQLELFNPRELEQSEIDDGVRMLSAPGENRECVEIARRILEHAGQGVPFERIAVLLRSPQNYAPHISEALSRAGIPHHLARGLQRPDPAGRGLLALLACRAEGFSAARFAEYLSLGCARSPDERTSAEGDWIAPEDQHGLLPEAAAPAAEPSEQELLEAARDQNLDATGTRPAPRRWERLLNEAAVIGGADRWQKRLYGEAQRLDLASAESESDGERARLSRDAQSLRELASFALPLIEQLAKLPDQPTWSWSQWLEALRELAGSALERPTRVLQLLGELEPMGDVGPVSIHEVQLVLSARLGQLAGRPSGAQAGRVFVSSVDDARGLAFDYVFIPGLAEKLFPHKVAEDPLLLDSARQQFATLPKNEQRVGLERSMLHLGVGAATRGVVFSYPRVDMERARPRVPSFYALEVVRAASGHLPSFEELAQRARDAAHGRMGWPAPERPELAIDDAEYDLALLESCLGAQEAEKRQGAAGYLVSANPHLGRALRFRARRWNLRGWRSADGLVDPSPAAQDALARHRLEARPYSATALEHFSACPYRFYLSAVLRLSPRETATRAERLDALTRGRLIHEVQQAVAEAMKSAGQLPLSAEQLPDATLLMEQILEAAEARYREQLAPAIERVWRDGIEEISGDLRGWLEQLAEDRDWEPIHFELAFGIRRADRDRGSRLEPVKLRCGITLRGAIDSVERARFGGEETLRATDYKTGAPLDVRRAALPENRGRFSIRGGRTLQPLLYAEALENLFPTAKISGGRLAYSTRRGEYREYFVPLDDYTRQSVQLFSDTLRSLLEGAFLPAAPEPRGCEYCDFKPVCGPYEEQRTARKTEPHPLIKQLRRLREEP